MFGSEAAGLARKQRKRFSASSLIESSVKMEIMGGNQSASSVVQPLPPSLQGQNPQIAEQHHAQAIRNMQEIGSKLFDVKGMLKFPVFDGRSGGWQEFRFRFENTCGLLGLSDGIKWAEFTLSKK